MLVGVKFLARQLGLGKHMLGEALALGGLAENAGVLLVMMPVVVLAQCLLVEKRLLAVPK